MEKNILKNLASSSSKHSKTSEMAKKRTASAPHPTTARMKNSKCPITINPKNQNCKMETMKSRRSPKKEEDLRKLSTKNKMPTMSPNQQKKEVDRKEVQTRKRKEKAKNLAKPTS